MDYGKEKFGGPFIEEEVEDVKIVLCLLPLVIIMLEYLSEYFGWYLYVHHCYFTFSCCLVEFLVDSSSPNSFLPALSLYLQLLFKYVECNFVCSYALLLVI